jgi:hypothetical protein
MKFGEKYELLESLTTGGVETFVANDKVRGQRVLVHILHCDPQESNQPTVQWVLETFRRIAPEPAGLVLETGRYGGTLYAYLVTKMPDEAALQGWVQLYKAQAGDTQEIPAPVVKPTPQSEAPTADLTSKVPAPAPGGVTELFRDFGSQATPGAPSAPSKPTQQPAPSLQNVKSAAERSGVRAAPDWEAVTPRISVPPKAEPNISSSPNSFSSTFSPRNFPSEPNAPTTKDGPRPGEFTSFFQGPFRVEGPSEIPAVSPPPTEPPRKSVGDFTAMFSTPLAPPSEEPIRGSGVAGNEPAGTGFTGWFKNPDIAPRTSGTAAPSSSGLPGSLSGDSAVFPAPSNDPFVPPKPAPYAAPTPPMVAVPPVFPAPAFPNPVIEKQPAPPVAGSASEGATNVFHRPAGEPVLNRQEAPSEPGAYTRIISVKAPGVPAGAQKQTSTDAPATPGFPATSMPALPKLAAPPIPKLPAPALPKLAVPPPPKPPKVALPEPPVSYWPLILTLTVLFFIAALLVLYFVLKH